MTATECDRLGPQKPPFQIKSFSAQQAMLENERGAVSRKPKCQREKWKT